MRNLKDIIAYIIETYPYKDELSNARLTKLVYLADWYHSIHHSEQLSSIEWYFDNYGPFVWDIFKTAENDESFKIEVTNNMFGKEKKLISLSKPITNTLSEKEKNSINKVIEGTKSLNWSDFINLVYSTYPILTSEKYTYLNLIEKAREHSINKSN